MISVTTTMSNLKSLAFMAAAVTFFPSVIATFNAAANSNMAVYWVSRRIRKRKVVANSRAHRVKDRTSNGSPTSAPTLTSTLSRSPS